MARCTVLFIIIIVSSLFLDVQIAHQTLPLEFSLFFKPRWGIALIDLTLDFHQIQLNLFPRQTLPDLSDFVLEPFSKSLRLWLPSLHPGILHLSSSIIIVPHQPIDIDIIFLFLKQNLVLDISELFDLLLLVLLRL